MQMVICATSTNVSEVNKALSEGYKVVSCTTSSQVNDTSIAYFVVEKRSEDTSPVRPGYSI